MATIVYTLCFLTATLCMGLLARAYARTRSRLLFWSALCFAGLALNEALVILDLVLVPERSFVLLRTIVGLLAVCPMLYGLVFGERP